MAHITWGPGTVYRLEPDGALKAIGTTAPSVEQDDAASPAVSWKDNPHRPGTPEFNEWQRQFIQSQQRPGTQAYAEAKVIADGRLAALKEQMAPSAETVAADAIYNEVDPTPQRSGESELDFYVRLQEHIKAWADAWERMFRTLNQVAGDVGRAEEAARLTPQFARARVDTFTIFDELTDDQPPATLRGKPVRNRQQRMCAQHGQPAGSCRACWRRQRR